MRDLDHFRRLHAACDGRSGPVRLATLATHLCCSERHARQLLPRLAARGWIVWQPGRGRGHCSRLEFLVTPDHLAADTLPRLLADGKIEQVMRTLPAEARGRLHALLPAFLGFRQEQGQRLRLPFYRPLHGLDPVRINRRTECHLLRQIFDGLTACDRRSGQIVPALAHAWRHDATLMIWDFHLRPGVHFHHGAPLSATDVRASLLRLRDLDGPFRHLLAHVADVREAGPLHVRITLTQPDVLLPHRLSRTPASIVPAMLCDRPGFDRLPSGTGPFRLVANSEYRACFAAFAPYWGVRPLLDEVEIWVVSDASVRARFDAHMHFVEGTARPVTHEHAEPGCTYLCVNPERLDVPTRRHVTACLLDRTASGGAQSRQARGFLPGWDHVPPREPGPIPEASLTLDLVTYALDSHRREAQAAALRLEAAGYAVRVHVLSYPEFARGAWRAGADLMLTGEVLDDGDFSLYEWLAGDSGFRPWLSEGQRDALDRALQAVACEPDATVRRSQCEQLCARLVAEGGLIPWSHEILSLSFDPRLNGIALEDCGWVDFRTLWFEPAD